MRELKKNIFTGTYVLYDDSNDIMYSYDIDLPQPDKWETYEFDKSLEIGYNGEYAHEECYDYDKPPRITMKPRMTGLRLLNASKHRKYEFGDALQIAWPGSKIRHFFFAGIQNGQDLLLGAK